MLRKLLLPLLAAMLVHVATAQTIGVPARNDLMVRMPPGLPTHAGSGATSCAFNAGTHSPTNAGSLQYRVDASSTATGAVIILSFCQPCGGANTINLGSTIPAFCGGGNAGSCLAGPGNANLCWGVSLAPGCSITLPLARMGTVFWEITIPIPAATTFPATLWAQALVVDACATQGWHMTPAIGIN